MSPDWTKTGAAARAASSLRSAEVASQTRRLKRAATLPWVIAAGTALDLVMSLAGFPSRFVFGLLGPSMLLAMGGYGGGTILGTACVIDGMVVALLIFLGLRARGGKTWALAGALVLTAADAALMVVDVLQFDNLPMETIYTHAFALIYLSFGLLAGRRLRSLNAAQPLTGRPKP